MKTLLKLFCLFIGINAAACIAEAEAAPKPNIINVSIDELFSGPERASLIRGLKGWEDQTGGAVRFRIDEHSKVADLGGVMIWKSSQNDNMIKALNKEIGCDNCLLGVTYWGQPSYAPKEVSMVYLVVDRLDTDRSFNSVSKHEIGHSLGIGHTTDTKGLMFSGYIDGLTPECMIKSDLDAFCGVQRCEGFKIKPCKP